MFDQEIWKSIPGFENLYEVSNLGRIKRVAHGRSWAANRLLNPSLSDAGKGYFVVTLVNKEGERKKCQVHRLVLLTFVGEHPEKKHVNHIDGDTRNNHLENLEWVTPKENVAHSINVLGTHRGERAGSAKLTDTDVLAILERLQNGDSDRVIARDYGVADSTITNIKLNTAWTHIDRNRFDLSKAHRKFKLSDEQVFEIIGRVKNGERQIEIAKDYNVDPSAISNIMRGKRWSKLTHLV